MVLAKMVLAKVTSLEGCTHRQAIAWKALPWSFHYAYI